MRTFLPSLALGIAASLAALSAPAAAKTPLPPQASIPFADHGGIRDFTVADDNTVYIQATGGRWYRADLMGNCQGLRFHNALGFQSNPGGSFDRWSSIRTRYQNCPVRSLTRADPPAKAVHKG